LSMQSSTVTRAIHVPLSYSGCIWKTGAVHNANGRELQA
jgi:hypothetical protein